MDSLSVLKRDAEVIRSRRAADVQSLQQEEAESARIVTQLQRNRTKYQKELAAKKRQVDALNREIQRIIAAAVNGKSGKSTARKPMDIKLDAEFAKNKGKLPWLGRWRGNGSFRTALSSCIQISQTAIQQRHYDFHGERCCRTGGFRRSGEADRGDAWI